MQWECFITTSMKQFLIWAQREVDTGQGIAIIAQTEGMLISSLLMDHP